MSDQLLRAKLRAASNSEAVFLDACSIAFRELAKFNDADRARALLSLLAAFEFESIDELKKAAESK